MSLASKVVPAADAVRQIRDGATVAVCGESDLMLPDGVLAALERRFLETGQPRDLTLFYPVIPGAQRPNVGIDRFAHPGMTRRVIGSSHYTLAVRKLNELMLANEVEGYLFPMGALWHLTRAIAAGAPGVLTPVGVGSMIDPRHGGGRVNARTTEDLVRVVEIDGQEYLFYRAIPIDVALIRGTTADPEGNLTLEEEPFTTGVLPLAMAARSGGGRVIAQVKRLAEAGSQHPKRVEVPGILVDAVVVEPEQDANAPYDPALTGDRPRASLEEYFLPLGPEKVVLRRAALELRPGGYYNLGFGLPPSLGAVVAEEGALDLVRMGTEHGPVGGMPLPKSLFGPALNPVALMDTPDIFCLYDGGRLDGTFLGIGELDRAGSVNVSLLGGYRNLGGFLDIVHAARQITFCSVFGGRDEARVEDGRLVVRDARPSRKFVPEVVERSFDAARAAARPIRYVTERAVFGLGPEGVEVLEVAPGVDLERDVLGQMGFRPRVSARVREMEAGLFRPGVMGLRERLEE